MNLNNILYRDGLFFKVIKENPKSIKIQQLKIDNCKIGTPEFIFNEYMYHYTHFSNDIDTTKPILNKTLKQLHLYEKMKENDISHCYILYDEYTYFIRYEYFKSDFFKCPDKLDNRIFIKKQIKKIYDSDYDKDLIEELVDYVGRKEFKIIELKKHMDISDYMEWYHTYKKFLMLISDNCPVCLDKGCTVGYYHCSHGICSSCYTTWKKKANTCPTCRACS